MIEVALMLEGQDGLNWPRWKRMVEAAESLGFVGLYRSDHYTNASPPDKDSLELWVSLTWLAANTEKIEFGPLVSPVSFRHPTMTARIGRDVDDLSRGRLTLGLGAGWQEREHTNYGWDLLDVPGRFARFEEGLEVITRLLKNEHPASFQGEYYQLREASLLPRPRRLGGPPISIGGNGPLRTLPLAARFADEWNAVIIPPAQFKEKNVRLDALLAAEGRSSASVRRSIMQGTVYGENEAQLQEASLYFGSSLDDLRAGGMLIGSASEIVDQLGAYAEVGVQRIMVQWLGLDDLDLLADFAGKILPQVHG